MTPEQQNIAIAKRCPEVARIDGAGVPVWLRNPFEVFEPTEDLNAMAEAEKALRKMGAAVWGQYVHELMQARGTNLYHNVIDATAAQRAEAFCKTLRLEESA